MGGVGALEERLAAVSWAPDASRADAGCFGQGYGDLCGSEKEKLADLLVARGVRRPLASTLRKKSRYAGGGVMGVFMFALFLSA